MAYSYTINEIHEKTGLKVNFIRRCITELKDLFEPHITKGENNISLFDDSGLILFDRIKQLKESDNLSIPEIRKHLGYQPVKPYEEGVNPGYETLSNQTVKPYETREENLVNRLYERLLQEKERAYQTEIEVKEKSCQAVLEAKSNVISSLQQQLKLLTNGKDPEAQRQEAEAKRKRKAEIIDRLIELDGHVFKGRERKRLLKELRGLE